MSTRIRRRTIKEIKQLCITAIDECPFYIKVPMLIEFSYTQDEAYRFEMVEAVMKSFLPEFVQDIKDDESAKRLREQGNKKFQKFHFEEAHEFYTKSITKAVPGSVQMALGYSNRSALLFEKKYYEECIMDIDRALQNACPEKIYSKLYIRKEKAEALKKVSQKLPIFDEAPRIPRENRNPKIKHAKEGIMIKNDTKYGRHIVATREINIGEILAIKLPLVSVLMEDKYISCHYCLKICYNLIPCDNCSQELYCSEKCKETAKEKYHNVECIILATINELNFNMIARLALRLLLINRQDIKNNTLNTLNKSNMIFNLQSNFYKRKRFFVMNYFIEGVVIFHLIQRHTDFFDEESFIFINNCKYQLIQLMEIVLVNQFKAVRTIQNETGLFTDQKTIGYYVTTFYAFLNHSCYPNILLVEHGDAKVMRAIRTIKLGEQLTISYLKVNENYSTTPKCLRQVILNLYFCFNCNCIACMNNWPVRYNLRNTIEQSAFEERYKIFNGDTEELYATISNLKSKIQEKEAILPPSFNAIENYELIQQCFFALGNKQFLF